MELCCKFCDLLPNWQMSLSNCVWIFLCGIPLDKILDPPLAKMTHDGQTLDAELARRPSPLSPCEGNIFAVQQRAARSAETLSPCWRRASSTPTFLLSICRHRPPSTSSSFNLTWSILVQIHYYLDGSDWSEWFAWLRSLMSMEIWFAQICSSINTMAILN